MSRETYLSDAELARMRDNWTKASEWGGIDLLDDYDALRAEIIRLQGFLNTPGSPLRERARNRNSPAQPSQTEAGDG